MITTIIGLIFALQLVMFLIAYKMQTDKLTDISYGLSFVIVCAYLLTLNYSLPYILLYGMIIIWGLRLASYLFVRILHMKSDKRFDTMRHDFIKFGGFWFLQAVAISVILLPVLFTVDSLQEVFYPAIIVFAMGLIIETIADYQKFVFKKHHPKKLMTSGLFSVVRYPNYLGEIMIWIAVFAYVIPSLMSWKWISVLSPIFIIVLLVFVSGIPLLEKSYEKKYPEFKEYRNKKKLIPFLI